ncbi:sensor histidine kinase [Paenibacillus eucommiae]|uniref:Two-component system sensor histidine kinase YesM n=1 Tax=Paenibacillus eucommiae TaxID=1355755 RepID=A0ABS4IX96_9BACL|nr:histidine kinase [Paenibacillus eucommiae]MBP1992193.1 two-component system sensor histidine kinase YesM [Paenibacillus eucommiae]
MFSFKTFQTKLFVTYSIFLIIFTLIISIPMYYYLKNTTKKNILAGIQQSVAGISESLDIYANQYENITTQLYLKRDGSGSQVSVVQALQNLMLMENDAEVLNAYTLIDNNITLLSEINKNIYRINIFNEHGLFFSNQPYDKSVLDSLSEDADWLQEPQLADGAMVMEYASQDHWRADGDPVPVFSFLRRMKWNGVNIGYLEVQIRADDLIKPVKLTSIPSASLTLFNQTDVLYSNDANFKDNNISRLMEFNAIIPSAMNNGQQSIRHHGNTESLIFQRSQKTDYTIAYAVSENKLFASLLIFRNVTFAAVFLLISLSILVFYILSKTLTYPITKLRKVIDSVDLDDKKIKINNEFKMDEIELLNRSFRTMNERLQNSLEEIVQFRTMELQSQFEVLQAQINPHFLFNMLGVIAIFSEEEGGTKAADVCHKLASFLRYTVIQTNPITTLEQEMSFARDYLELMQTRYRHRLQFELVLPEEMKRISIPKLTLQPLVENSINHGFQHMDRGLVITIRGIVEGDRWYITILDNGSGIDPEQLKSLHEKMEMYERPIHVFPKKEQLTLGGMGIISTYARLKLYFKNRIAFRIGNNADYGTCISISGWIPDESDEHSQEESP